MLAIAAALSSVLTANYNASAIDEVQTCLREAVHNCSCQQIAAAAAAVAAGTDDVTVTASS